MHIVSSAHWTMKRRYRPDISDHMIEYAVIHAPKTKDRHDQNLYNALCRILPSGRMLKVVYKPFGLNTKKVVTAYWID